MPPSKPEELPVVTLIGIAPTGRSDTHVVVKLSVQGRKVIDEETLSDPEPWNHAVTSAKVAMVRHVFKVGAQ